MPSRLPQEAGAGSQNRSLSFAVRWVPGDGLGWGRSSVAVAAAVTTRRVQEAGAPHTGAMGRHQRRVASARERTRARETEREREGERMSLRSTLRLASAKTRGLDAGAAPVVTRGHDCQYRKPQRQPPQPQPQPKSLVAVAAPSLLPSLSLSIQIQGTASVFV